MSHLLGIRSRLLPVWFLLGRAPSLSPRRRASRPRGASPRCDWSSLPVRRLLLLRCFECEWSNLCCK
ncbi:hypothetical protein ACOSP7_003927 [Xanthoceras sorbifolium]